MTTTRDIQNFFHRLIELQSDGYSIDIQENSLKNYTTYYISQTNGNAEYRDCVIMYNGKSDAEYPENVCDPQDIPAEELLGEIENIVNKIDSVFGEKQ